MRRNLLYIILAMLPLCARPQSASDNYIIERDMLDESGSRAVTTVRYYDGLGRPSHTAVSGRNTDGSYIHTAQEYDMLGRVWMEWSPVTSQTAGIIPVSEYASQASDLYSDPSPFSVISYDSMDRRSSATTPGAAWAESPGREDVRANRYQEVRMYRLTSDGSMPDNTLSYYCAGTLLCTERMDEDGKTVLEYHDLDGRLILDRRLEPEAAGIIDTYYIYNDLGQLRFVLIPGFQDYDDLVGSAYEYRYDSRGRVILKRLPGSMPVEYWYDRADRMICMQDGEMRSRGLYRRYFYDFRDRLALQCLSGESPRSNELVDLSPSLGGAPTQSDPFLEYGYTCTSRSGAAFIPDILSVEAVSYYDTYSYISLLGSLFDSRLYSRFAADLDSLTHTGADCLIRERTTSAPATGRLQFTGDGDPVLDAFVYDRRGRPTATRRLEIGDALSTHDLTYTFTDDPVSDLFTYSVPGSGETVETILSGSTMTGYHPGTRLPRETVLSIADRNGNVETDTIADRGYDSLGHLVSDRRGGVSSSGTDMHYAYDLLHGWISTVSSSCGFLQHLYRESGGEHPCLNGSISAMEWRCGQNDITRRYDYEYDGLNRLIGSTYSEAAASGASYTDGDESLVRSLIPGTSQAEAEGRYSEYVSYDSNSSITSLERYGMLNDRSYGLIDDLEIEYFGTQRISVRDHSGANLSYVGSSDFEDGSDSELEYEYNDNGALIRDLNKGIESITYDDWGNIRDIVFEATSGRVGSVQSSIGYTYLPDGTRQKALHVTNRRPHGTISETDYRGNLILEDGHLSMYRFPGGYVSFRGDSIEGIHYYIQDYMGNNRMVVNGETGDVEQVTHYYPNGAVIGDLSQNGSLQRFKFEGKELDRSFGLDWYDIQARQYDGLVPGWNRPDDKAHDYTPINPYAYCAGDPVNYGDYNGRDTITANFSDGVWSIESRIPGGESDIYYLKMESSVYNYEITSPGDISVLQIEDNGIATIGIMNIRGKDGFSCLTVTPPGVPSAEDGSGVPIPDGTYDLRGLGNKSSKWGCLGPVVIDPNTKRDRGIRIHYAGKEYANKWTKGCFVVCDSYKIKGSNIIITVDNSINIYNNINEHFGGKRYIGDNGRIFYSYPSSLKKIMRVKYVNNHNN